MGTLFTMKRVTVLFVQRVPWGGGAERVVRDIVDSLDLARFAPKVLCLYAGPPVPEDIAPRCRYLFLFPNSFYFEILQRWYFFRLVKAALRKSLQLFIRSQARIGYLLAARREKRLKEYCLEKTAKFLRIRTCGNGVRATATNNAPPVRQAASPARRPVDDYAQAVKLAAYVSTIHGPLVIVPVMEEAASVVRQAMGHPMSGKPYILSTHAWESYYLPVMYGQPGYDIEREKRLFAEACRGAEVVLGPCDGCRDDLIGHFASPPERIMTMPNPVDIAGIQEAMLKMPEKPLPPDWKDMPFFIVVGRLDPQKRHDRILRACALLRNETESFRVAVIGDGRYRRQIEAEIASLRLESHIRLLGACANPFPYMSMAAGLLCASDSESFGLTLVEALACGCVPISVDCPHAPRDVLAGGKAGFLTPETPEGLAEAMLTVLRRPDEARARVEFGREHIRQYDLPIVVRKWENLLLHVAGTHYA